MTQTVRRRGEKSRKLTLKEMPEIINFDSFETFQINVRSKSLGHASTGGISSFGRMLSEAVETQNLPLYEMINMLHLKAVTIERATERSRHIFGRIYNSMVGENINYVELSGHHLMQILQTVGGAINAPEFNPKGRFGLRYDIAKSCVDELSDVYKKQHASQI